MIERGALQPEVLVIMPFILYCDTGGLLGPHIVGFLGEIK